MAWNYRGFGAAVLLGLGLLGGLMLAGLWPSMPLHAVATDKIDTFSMATGPIDVDYEAVYFLDHLSGDLHAYVVGRNANGGYGPVAHYFRNIAVDFKANGEKAPKYLMATGLSDLSRGGRGATVMPSKAVLYIADVTSGVAAAFAVPNSTTAHVAGRFTEAAIIPLCQFKIRQVANPAGPTGKKGKAAADAF